MTSINPQSQFVYLQIHYKIFTTHLRVTKWNKSKNWQPRIRSWLSNIPMPFLVVPIKHPAKGRRVMHPRVYHPVPNDDELKVASPNEPPAHGRTREKGRSGYDSASPSEPMRRHLELSQIPRLQRRAPDDPTHKNVNVRGLPCFKPARDAKEGAEQISPKPSTALLLVGSLGDQCSVMWQVANEGLKNIQYKGICPQITVNRVASFEHLGANSGPPLICAA